MTKHYDFVPTGCDFGRHYRSVIGLGAAARKEGLFQIRGRDLVELFREVGLWLIGVQGRRMRNRVYLVNNRLVHFRVCVAEADRQHAAKAIQIAIILVVPYVHSLALDQRNRLFVVHGHSRKKEFFLFLDGIGLGCFLFC